MFDEKLPLASQDKPGSKPFFSVVTVGFNNYDELLLTYESVRKQSCKDFEWIVIDGASKDNTVAFLRTIKMDNFSYLSEKDKSHFDAMNKGISRSTGVFIVFLNSGDCFDDENTLQLVKAKYDQAADRDIIDFIYGDSKEQDVTGNIFYRKSRKFWRRKIGMFTHHQAMFYRRSVLFDNGIYYNLGYPMSGDYEFTLNVIKHSRSVLYVPESLCIFLQGGFTENRWLEGIKQANDIRIQYFKMNKLVLFSIYSYQYLLHVFRFKFTSVYNFLRFTRQK